MSMDFTDEEINQNQALFIVFFQVVQLFVRVVRWIMGKNKRKIC